jgi:hypothetical protein
MNNLTIEIRLVLVIGFLSVLLGAIGFFGLSGLSQNNEELLTAYEDR